MDRTLLTNQGGDRATAYTMSNKIVRLPGAILCTWLDVNRQNSWGMIDPDSGNGFRWGTLGDTRMDNHCGAALALAPDGRVHAVIGGHHSAFEHYRLDSIAEGIWRHIATIDAAATYPSLICDRAGTLHLAFRCQREPRWTLDYCTFRDGIWSAPRPLVIANKPGYVYWTNSLALGPKDRLHLVFANVRVQPEGALYHGAAHLCSDDGGATWSDFGAGFIGSEPVSVEKLPLLEGEASPARIATADYLHSHAEPGPSNREYLQMLLSNVVVDPDGTPHVIVHNGLQGTAALWSYTAVGWYSLPLTAVVTRIAPGFRIHMQSSLSCDHSGDLHVALMLEPTSECMWGPNGTRLVRLLITPKDGTILVEDICASGMDVAQWLPILEQPGFTQLDHKPALMYTCGINAGGFGANKNQMPTEVWCIS